MSNKISHLGVVDSIEGDRVKVRIIQTSACAACKVATHCTASESKVKMVDVFGCDTAKYKAGQEVTVWASREVAPFDVLATELEACGKDLGVVVKCQREEIFDSMHRI